MIFNLVLTQFFVIGMVFIRESWSLTCFQNDEETGEIQTVTKDDYVYCSLFPAVRHPVTGKLVHAQVDGIIQEEVDGPFKKFFDAQEPYYQVLSICLYERYHFFPNEPSKPAEYQFRCICNTDRCNSPSTFEPYLGTLRRNSQDNRVESA
uniref:Uncharacterized protein n=1 Tax=Acrobeloides nanus TaxID=290746 RepID=A0A914CF37_9BILA